MHELITALEQAELWLGDSADCADEMDLPKMGVSLRMMRSCIRIMLEDCDALIVSENPDARAS